MIRNFAITSVDKEHIVINGKEKKLAAPQQEIDFSKLVVNKPWGYEYLVYSNPAVEIWSLFIKKLASTSMHCHPNKKTSLILLEGSAIFSSLNEEVKLNFLDAIVMEPGVFHTTQAISENGIHLLEIETPPDKYDLIRLQDRYGRVNYGYEGLNLMSPDEKGCLRFFDYSEGSLLEKEHLNKKICIQEINTSRIKSSDIKDHELIVIIGSKNTGELSTPVSVGDVYKGAGFLEKIDGCTSVAQKIMLMCINSKN